MKVLDNILHSSENKDLKRYEKIAEQAMSLEEDMQALTDEELHDKTQEFKDYLIEDEKNSIDDLIVEAFAVVREAAYRVLGLKAYKVQLIGAAAIHDGKIAEMKTGEGKALVAVFPSYLNALTGHSVHIVTVNDYLAEYQGEMMGRVLTFLNMSTGIIISDQSQGQRKEQYQNDVIYGTNNEFGFDYLRDNMVKNKEEKVQTGHHFAIVDEVDSILIDEARTPLIISGIQQNTSEELFKNFSRIVKHMNIDEHYEVDFKKRTVGILDKGIDYVEKELNVNNLYETIYVPYIGLLQNAIKAKELFKKDKDYVVANNEIFIVDEHTGRILSGRRYNENLHQSIEAKEGVAVNPETQVMATITLQNYFKLYTKLAGMTGTAATEAAEFMTTYKLPVISIPTNKEVKRVDKPDFIFATEKAKFEAVVKKIQEQHEVGRPILIGTASVEKSEYLSNLLKKEKIPHNVLNAKENDKEALIVAEAGKLGAVTVATNMAGRGTDIILGGNAEVIVTHELEKMGLNPENDAEKYQESWDILFPTLQEKAQEEAVKIKELGGLLIIGTERHESRRIDNQLRGRSGRQGDPGESIFYLSIEDDLVRRFANSDTLKNFIQKTMIDDSVPITGKIISRSILTAQKRVEAHNYELRKNIVKYDEILTNQRKQIYQDRDEVLDDKNLDETFDKYIDIVISKIVDKHTSHKNSEDFDYEELSGELKTLYNPSITVDEVVEKFGGKEEVKAEDLKKEFLSDAHLFYNERKKNLGVEGTKALQREIMLNVIDKKWREHLSEMDYLKDGIALRAVAQKDPLIEYNQEGHQLFNEMIDKIREDAVGYMLNLNK